MKVDWLVVGAGFTGCVVAERIANVLGETVLVIDRRNHIGGNAFDRYDDRGVLIHQYGPHIFHTNSERIWNYLSRFTDWHPYEHRVLAMVDGELMPVPFNLTAIEKLFPSSTAKHLRDLLVSSFGYGARIPILKLRQNRDDQIRQLANYIFDKIFLGYTKKQWGLNPEQLDPSVTARVPVLISNDDRYFQDTFQALPKRGYTEMFRRMLEHPCISVILNTEYGTIKDEISYRQMVFTGPIDEYFNYRLGRLPYRSLRFEFTSLDQALVQPVGTINYPNDFAYTRVTEFKHLTGQIAATTSIVYEYPTADGDPYYPVPRAENATLYSRYLTLASELENVHFAGRLADYKYYNMDQAVGRALALFEKTLIHRSSGRTKISSELGPRA